MKFSFLILLLFHFNTYGQLNNNDLKINLYKTWFAKYIRFDNIKLQNLNHGKIIVESDLDSDTTIQINLIDFLLLADTSKIERYWLKPLTRNNGVFYYSIKSKALSLDTIDIFTKDLDIRVHLLKRKIRKACGIKYKIETHMNSCKGENYISDGRFIYDLINNKWLLYKVKFNLKEDRFETIKVE